MKSPSYCSIVLVSFALLAVALPTGCTKAAKQARHASRADAFVRKGDYASAEVEYLNALRYAPRDPALIRKLAEVFREQGRTMRALGAFTLLKEAQPEDSRVHLDLAQLFFTSRDYPAARREALFVCTNQAGNSTALLVLAESSFKSNELVEAGALIQKAAAQSWTPGLRVAAASLKARQGQLAEAEQQLKAIPVAQGSDPSIDLAWAKLRIAQTNLIEAEVLLKRAAEASPLRSTTRLQWLDYRILRGDVAGARQALEQMAQKAPDYLPALLRLADIALSEKRFTDCDRLTVQALRLESSSHEALLLRARMWTLQGTLDKALDELVRLDSEFPTNVAVKYELALAHGRAGDRARAVALANEAYALDPHFPKAALLKAELNLTGSSPDPAGAAAIIAPVLRQNPALRQAAVLLGRAFMMQGRTADAVRVYRDIASRYQSDAELWVLLGIALRQARDIPGARAAFDQALKVNSLFFPAVEQLAALDTVAGDVASALARAADYTTRATNRVDGLLLESRIHLARSNYPAAEASLNGAAARAPESFSVFAALADLYVKMGDYDRSLAKLDAALAKNPKSFLAWTEKGIIHETRHEPALAIDAYQRCLAINKNYAPALNNLAVLRSAQPNGMDEALSLASAAHSAAPENPAIADTLGWLLYRRGDLLGARRLLSASAEKIENPEVQYHAGMVAYSLGDEEVARHLFRSALASPELARDARTEVETRLAVLDVPLDKPSPAHISRLEAAVKRDDRDYVADWRLGNIYLRQNRADEAARLFEKASRANPQAARPLVALARLDAEKNPTRALQLARDARKLAPGDPATALVLGSLLVRNHEYAPALPLLVEGLRTGDPQPETLYAFAVAQYANGKFSDARAGFSAVLQRATGATQQIARDALVLVDDSRPDEKLSVAQARSKADPADILALVALAEARQKQNDARGAAQLYERVLASAPACTPIRQRLAALYLDGLGDENAAYAHAIKARQQAPGDPQIARLLGRIAVKQGSFAEAIRYLQETTVASADGEPYYLLGVANFGLHRTNDAKLAFAKAAALPLKPELASDIRRRLADLK